MQRRIHSSVVGGETQGVIMTLQHINVLTLGKHAKEDFLLKGRDQLSRDGIDVIETDRGGEVTAHNPGQLVVYPILHQSIFNLSPRTYVYLLEQGVIDMLKTYGLNAVRDEHHPGVWLGQEKICALGVRIRQRVSMHGLALNICNDLELFNKIIPCGISERGVTSLEKSLRHEVSFAEVRNRLLESLGGLFKVSWVHEKP